MLEGSHRPCVIFTIYTISLPCPLSSAFLANITGPIEGCKVFNSFIISDVPVAADPSRCSLSTTMRSLVWLSLLVSRLSLVSSQGNAPWPLVALTARWSLGKLTQLNPFSLPAGVSIDRILFCSGRCITFVTLLSPAPPLMINRSTLPRGQCLVLVSNIFPARHKPVHT